MVSLNDYLYDSNTVLKILHGFYEDLKDTAIREQNGVDLVHSNILLQEMDLTKIDVNMFDAVSNQLVNDGCGLFKGRLILPYEHLSRFQNDLID